MVNLVVKDGAEWVGMWMGLICLVLLGSYIAFIIFDWCYFKALQPAVIKKTLKRPNK